MSDDEGEFSGGPSEEQLALRARIEELEHQVLTGQATLDDYGALALAQREWQRLEGK